MPFADICVTDRESCPNEWPVLLFSQNSAGNQSAVLRNTSGDKIDLTGLSVCLSAKEYHGSFPIIFSIEGTVDDAENGEVTFSPACANVSRSGLFLGEITVLSTPSGETACDQDVSYRIPCYVEVCPSISDSGYWGRGGGALTISEIRLAIRDKCREDNFLLDNVEFSDTEIAWAIRRPVEYWNEIPPPLRPLYSPANFPYRYHWTIGVIGELLRIAGPHYERNRLPYSAGGVSVDDKNKGSFYVQIGDKYVNEYREWVLRKKYEINIAGAFGRTELSAYGNNGLPKGVGEY